MFYNLFAVWWSSLPQRGAYCLGRHVLRLAHTLQTTCRQAAQCMQNQAILRRWTPNVPKLISLSACRLPAKFKSTYLHLHNDLNYSDLTLFAGERVGWDAGLWCCGALDCCSASFGRLLAVFAQHDRARQRLHCSAGSPRSHRAHCVPPSHAAGLLAVPVVVGLSFICMLDAYYSRRPLTPPPTRPHFE